MNSPKKSMKNYDTGINNFPTNYNEDTFYLLEIDPYHLHAFWSLDHTRLASQSHAQMSLRVYENIQEPGSFYDLLVSSGANNYYIELKQPAENCRVVLGIHEAENIFKPLLESQVNYTIESVKKNSDNKPTWMSVNKNGLKDSIFMSPDEEDRVENEKDKPSVPHSGDKRKALDKKEIVNHYRNLSSHAQESYENKKGKLSLLPSLVPDVPELFSKSAEVNSTGRLLDKNFFSNLDESAYFSVDYDKKRREELFQGKRTGKDYFSQGIERREYLFQGKRTGKDYFSHCTQ